MKKKLFTNSAFVDELSKVKSPNFHPLKGGDVDWQDVFYDKPLDQDRVATANAWWKITMLAFTILIFFGLFLRLFHLQISQGSENRLLADSNRIQVRIIHAPRGVIYDRNGKIMAQNEPGFRLVSATSSAKTRYISRDEEVQMEVNKDPELKYLELDNLRSYPLGEQAAHIIGYVGEVSQDELTKSNELSTSNSSGISYHNGDRVGRAGVESVYESILRGIDGGEVIEVDAAGNYVRTIGRSEPIPGQNVILSIDADLQKVAYQALQTAVRTSKSCCGAVVVQDPRNGQILALGSYPSYNPDHIEDYFSDPNSPLLNRAISGIYPPGSTFKIAMALAGLNSGKITPQTMFEDTGVMALGPYTFANWYYSEYGRKEEGGVNLVRALQRSNDIFFYHLGQDVGEKMMGDVAKQLGFGRQSGVDLPGESTGLIPTDEWKLENYDQPWYPGDSLHMAIGQGFVEVTPLQISNLISFIADNGKAYPPHLGYKITSPTGQTIKEYKYDSFSQKFEPSYISLVQQGLNLVPKNGGTAWPFFNFPVPTAGKTGTAEFGDPKNKTHAWYTSYAPVDKPQLAVTALVEAGGEGSTVASPIAKEIYRWYFSPDKTKLILDINQVATESARTLGE